MTELFQFEVYDTSPIRPSIVWLQHEDRGHVSRLSFRCSSITTVMAAGGKRVATLTVSLSDGQKCRMDFKSYDGDALEDATDAALWFESAMCEKERES